MLSRCYNPNHPEYNAYGNKNIKVCNKWLCFESFYNDIENIDGWNKQLFENHQLELDKDIKQWFSNNKQYAINNCMWVLKDINNKNQHSQQHKFIAISPTGEIFYDYNISDFANKNNLERKSISAVLHHRINSHKGWKFKFY